MQPCSPNRKKTYNKTYMTPSEIYLTNRSKTFWNVTFLKKQWNTSFTRKKKLQPRIETWLSYGGMHLILKATDCRFAKHQISECESVCLCVCVWLGVNIHTYTDWFTGQSFPLKMVCSHRVSLFISVNSVSTRGWFGYRDSAGVEFLFTRLHFHMH